MTTVSFLVPGVAVGKGRPRFAKQGRFVRVYTDDKTANYESTVRAVALKAMEGRKVDLMVGPVVLRLVVNVAPAASWTKKKTEGALLGEIRPTSKPDIDNVIKSIADALNGVVYKDDSQIIEVSAVKTYYPESGVYVEVIAL